LEAERGDRLRGGALERENRKTGEAGAGEAKKSEIGSVGTYVYTRAGGRQAEGGAGGVGPPAGALIEAACGHALARYLITWPHTGHDEEPRLGVATC
jgi:hypothetical protein